MVLRKQLGRNVLAGRSAHCFTNGSLQHSSKCSVVFACFHKSEHLPLDFLGLTKTGTDTGLS